MADKNKKEVYKFDYPEIQPATNGYILSCTIRTKSPSNKDTYSSWDWVGDRKMVFKKDEYDKALKVLTRIQEHNTSVMEKDIMGNPFEKLLMSDDSSDED